MIDWTTINNYSLSKKINTLFEQGTFVVSIRYYKHKINLYLLGRDYIEVFVDHKQGVIDRITKLDTRHSRMKFYCDQIKFSDLLTQQG